MGEIITVSRTGAPSLPPLVPESQKAIRSRIKLYLEQHTGFHITDNHIFKLELEHNSNIKVPRMSIEIGTKIYKDEPIIAIFESKGWYLVCTKSRGSLIGSPLYIDGNDVVNVIEFTDKKETA